MDASRQIDVTGPGAQEAAHVESANRIRTDKPVVEETCRTENGQPVPQRSDTGAYQAMFQTTFDQGTNATAEQRYP